MLLGFQVRPSSVEEYVSTEWRPGRFSRRMEVKTTRPSRVWSMLRTAPVQSSWSFWKSCQVFPSSRLRITQLGRRVPGSASWVWLFQRQSSSRMFMNATMIAPFRVRHRARSVLMETFSPSLNIGEDCHVTPSSALISAWVSCTARMRPSPRVTKGPRVSVGSWRHWGCNQSSAAADGAETDSKTTPRLINPYTNRM